MNTKIIILAAGKGKRMKNGNGLPKVLSPLNGQPLILHLLHRVKQSGIDSCPIIVVGHAADQVRQTCGPAYTYVEQTEQLGTAHAVEQALPTVPKNTDAIIVLYGDHPLTSPLTIKTLHLLHQGTKADISLLTATVPHFNGWQKPFYDFGRIIRDKITGNITHIIEKKDAEPEELNIREINPGMYCFNKAWLARHIDRISNNNTQGEYYLTDLVRLAIRQGAKLVSLPSDPVQALGINTPEHLALTEKLVTASS